MAPTSIRAVRTASERLLLTQLATVYTENATTGRYTDVLLNALPCRVIRPKNLATAAASSASRAELLAERDLWWPAGTILPEQCRVLVDGVTYQPRAGTFESIGDGATVAIRRGALVRIQTTSF